MAGETFNRPSESTQAKPTALPVGRTPARVGVPIVVGRGEPPDGRRTTKPAFEGRDPASEEAFVLYGQKIHLTSSWLSAAQYSPDTHELGVWFNDGAAVIVEDVTEREARIFFNAPSKGGWYWDYILGRGYQKGMPSTALKKWR